MGSAPAFDRAFARARRRQGASAAAGALLALALRGAALLAAASLESLPGEA